MKKPAITNIDIHPLIKERYSPRTFDATIPNQEVLDKLIEAVRWAPSSANDQPWKLIIGVKGSNTHDKIFDSLVDFNQKWAHLAPILIVICGITISAKTGKENSAYRYDCGQAAAYLTFQAMHENLFTHQMGGFSKDVIINHFSLDPTLDPQVVIALGYEGKIEYLDPKFQQMEIH